jgi:hypothetical protein
MLQEFIVLNVMLLSIGMLLIKDVSHANQDTLGMKLYINAHAANYQDKLLVLTVYAHHQKLNGIVLQRPALVHQTHLVINANHAQLQDNGTSKQTLVIAHHQLTSGMDNNVSAQQENTVQAVSNAQPQDIGTSKLINVTVELHSSGTDKTVFAHNHISYTKEDVLNAQMDSNGKITNVKNATALSKIWKFYNQEFESDRFIHLFQNKILLFK